MKEVIKYHSDDGKHIFDTKEECLAYDNSPRLWKCIVLDTSKMLIRKDAPKAHSNFRFKDSYFFTKEEAEKAKCDFINIVIQEIVIENISTEEWNKFKIRKKD